MAKDTTLIPESIVTLLFDQVKESSEENTKAIRELADNVDCLAKLLSSPTLKEVQDESKRIDDHDVTRQTEVLLAFSNMDTKEEMRISGLHTSLDGLEAQVKNDVKNSAIEVKGALAGIKNAVDNMSSKLKTMIIIVCVTFSLMATSYLFVRGSVMKTVDHAVTTAIERMEK
jgi:hypothetical protein